ncbi:3-methyl-2-oxobutanoate hydroxymethyltransferase [Wolbachia endosymbiont of Ctenocephalides felis wCfeT]|uniref:3-methyl-2-oxobutanoate hydroxymethyltransferase n=1 Tax=Wolbachia endosymbiont of Ctenocephalides felis wCfeT TaxID=2732593 RepID=UPI001444BA9F|nr:3-methyl-2-oxobutanoate hydroxymethyltransferase [Wolbachia endosymbiont of Ctenocephalides felis wCfeT]
MASILKFQDMKKLSKGISMVTCYDYWSARIIDGTNIDAILVGDSLAMVMHGHKDTILATVELMCMHVGAVARGAKQKTIIVDMPFLSFRKGLTDSMNSVLRIIQSGAHAIKIEGAKGNLELISHIVESGIPVMGHLGLTPQFVNQLGGFKVQGKQKEEEEEILQSAIALERSGCFAIVLECIPAKLAGVITEKLQIPTIGIGAGPSVSGQVLVLQDMLGMNSGFSPKFLKTYLDGYQMIKNALNDFDEEVKTEKFPLENHCYY